MKNKHYKKGIAIFIAVIAVAAMLLIALAISDLSYKEQIVSFFDRDSKVAFYAADSGIECAVFHDWSHGTDGSFEFATSSESNGSQIMHCGGTNSVHTFVEPTSQSATTTFYFNVSTTPKACAIVHVSKSLLPDGSEATTITSLGYNNTCKDTGATANPMLDDSNPRNLERSFRMTY